MCEVVALRTGKRRKTKVWTLSAYKRNLKPTHEWGVPGGNFKYVCKGSRPSSVYRKKGKQVQNGWQGEM